MVGCRKVVVDSLGHAYNLHFIIVIRRKLRELGNGVHRVVSAYVEEIADVVLLEYFDKTLVGLGISLGRFHLLSARAESRGGSLLKDLYLLLIGKDLGKIDEIFLKEALNSVTHTVKGVDNSVCLCVECASDNASKSCVYCRGRSARLSYDRVAV